MSFWKKMKGELIDIIEWTDSSQDTMVYRFERHGNEIKNGAQLTVRESQAAVFINEGKMADVFPPGRYELSTANMPILSTLKGWKYGFNSPFKAEVYFVNTKRFTGKKWGTPNPFYIRDADFGRVTLRAFGTYSMKVSDPAVFMKEVVGTHGEFSTTQIRDELRSLIVTQFITAIGESGLPLLDMAQNYKKVSDFCGEKLGSEFVKYGLEVTTFLVSSINLPEKLQAKLDEGTGMNMLGDMNKYQQMKMADSMEGAANNPGMGGGMEGMMGMAMMQQMMNQNQMMQNRQNVQNQTAGGPPPPPQAPKYFVSVNGQQQGPFGPENLQQLASQNQLTKDTYVWKEGMSGWQKAGDVAELNPLFAAPPPPPPPPPPPAPPQ